MFDLSKTLLQIHCLRTTGLIFCLSILANSLTADDVTSHQPFFQRYCTQCHAKTEPKGDVRLDNLSSVDADLWQNIYEQLASDSMPPDDKPQPSESERRAVERVALRFAEEDSPVIATGLRRLNRREYANTVRDLLGLHAGTYDPGEYIYKEEIDEGFDTEAESLVISNELLLEYMSAAEKSLRQALFSLDPKKPSPEVTRVKIDKMDGVGGNRYINNHGDHIICRSGGKGKVYDGLSSRAVTVPGRYTITVTAAGVDRDTYPIRLIPEKGPLVMGVGVAPDAVASVSGDDQLLKTFPLNDNVDQTFQFDIWIDKGYYPYFSFVNGPSKPITQIRSNIRRRNLPASAMQQAYKGPGIRINRFMIKGPHHDEWPAASIRTTIDANKIPDVADETARQQLVLRFVNRAFRRQVSEQEISPHLAFLDKQYAATGDWCESLVRTFAAMMSSIDFLYIREQHEELGPHELASRLSYFFWSTMPDDELAKLAQTGKLEKPSVLRDQVSRMLRDPRSEQFSTSFADQWLALDKLGTMPPDAKGEFRAYYKQNLEAAMLEETHRFFRYVLHQNQSVRDFINADYSFVNQPLAKLYGVRFDSKDANEFQRVTFPVDAQRGGLFGHSSVLTLSANGVETSPIERGVWVLAELFGTPPPPPPKAVPALTPDLNGAVTVRQMLEKHRSDPACMECHRRMDPLGFALEAFDPIGQLRTEYSKSQTVSTHGNYLGQHFADVTELKHILANDLRPFARNLIVRIAEYAKGRRLVAADFQTVEELLETAAKNDFRFKDIVLGIAVSDLMTDR